MNAEHGHHSVQGDASDVFWISLSDEDRVLLVRGLLRIPRHPRVPDLIDRLIPPDEDGEDV